MFNVLLYRVFFFFFTRVLTVISDFFQYAITRGSFFFFNRLCTVLLKQSSRLK